VVVAPPAPAEVVVDDVEVVVDDEEDEVVDPALPLGQCLWPQLCLRDSLSSATVGEVVSSRLEQARGVTSAASGIAAAKRALLMMWVS
jgi:hypothetical protein